MLSYDLPLFRKTDPMSSREAADLVVKTGTFAGQKRQVLNALQEHPGSTSAELAEVMGVDRYVTARRLPDLARDGLVCRGPIRSCTVKKTLAVTWRPGLKIVE